MFLHNSHTILSAPMLVETAVKHFLSVDDLSANEMHYVLEFALRLKQKRVRKAGSLLSDKCFAMVFQKPSTRTRVSFEAGVARLGGKAIYLAATDLQLSRGEPISDTAKVLSRYVDGLFVRLFNHADAVQLAKHARVPVLNALTDLEHPCQALADLLTLQEHYGRLAGLTLAYVGDAENNVVHSLLLGCSKLGIHVRLSCPSGYAPADAVFKAAMQYAEKTGSEIFLTEDPIEAVTGADAVYTDTWISMGDESEKTKRIQDLTPYQVTSLLMKQANPEAIFMHDLPAYRGNEVTAEVIDGPRSVVWNQAENKMHAQNAVLVWLLGRQKTTPVWKSSG